VWWGNGTVPKNLELIRAEEGCPTSRWKRIGLSSVFLFYLHLTWLNGAYCHWEKTFPTQSINSHARLWKCSHRYIQKECLANSLGILYYSLVGAKIKYHSSAYVCVVTGNRITVKVRKSRHTLILRDFLVYGKTWSKQLYKLLLICKDLLVLHRGEVVLTGEVNLVWNAVSEIFTVKVMLDLVLEMSDSWQSDCMGRGCQEVDEPLMCLWNRDGETNYCGLTEMWTSFCES
jgi:hypothetical protein